MTAYMERLNEKYGLFADFLVSCGIDCQIEPPGQFLIIRDDGEIFGMDESRIEAFKRKVSLFVQMESLFVQMELLC